MHYKTHWATTVDLLFMERSRDAFALKLQSICGTQKSKSGSERMMTPSRAEVSGMNG